MAFFDGNAQGRTQPEDYRRYLIAALIFTALFPYELWGTVQSSSITLLGDAFHVAADGLAAWMSFWAVWSARRARTPARGKLWRVRGIFVNGCLLLLTAPVVLFLGIAPILKGAHTMDPHEALKVIAVGITLNLIVYFFVYGPGRQGDELGESVRWHALSDALTSVVALASAELVAWTGIAMWDPLLSLLVACVLMWRGGKFVHSAWHQLRELRAVPRAGTSPFGVM